MDMELTNRVVIVTGGAKGIGEGISRAFAAEGAQVVIFSRNPDDAGRVITDIEGAGGNADHRVVELTNSEAVRSAIDSVHDTYQRIDVLVNNAGVNDGVGLDQGPEAFRKSLETNLVQFYSMVHFALGPLKKAKGSVINIGSKVAVTGQGGTSAYAAAKGGVNGLTREWALDLAADGVRVNTVIPAEVMTPLYEKFLQTRQDPAGTRKIITDRIPLGHRFTTCEEIANTVVFLASARSSHTTGQILYVDGGYTHFDRMYELMQAEG